MLVVLDRTKTWGRVSEIIRSNFEFAGTLIRSSLKVETERSQEHLKARSAYVEDLAKSPPGTRTCVIENSNTSEEVALRILYEAIVSGSRIWSSSVLSSRAAEAEKRQ